jgi:hypothetical protein
MAQPLKGSEPNFLIKFISILSMQIAIGELRMKHHFVTKNQRLLKLKVGGGN